MNYVLKHIKGEDILVKIKTKSNIGFWQYQIFGLLSLFMDSNNDFFIITHKRILISIKGSIKTNCIYSGFSNIRFNTKSDILTFKNQDNQTQEVSLSDLKLEYDDYQYLKQMLKT